MNRRRLLIASAGGLALRSHALNFAAPKAPFPIRAEVDRIVDIAVGIRPFRAQGPRLALERHGSQALVHHYGHGGSGWSLSWGSAQVAMGLIAAGGARPGDRIAVVGAGAIGLTTARTAQQAGLKVRLYAQNRPPHVHSSAATGLWTPDSRIVTAEHATDRWTDGWEAMARASFRVHQSYLGLPSAPVAWHDGYVVAEQGFDTPLPAHDDEPDYPDLHDRLAHLRPASEPVPVGEHPFGTRAVRRFTQMVFNIPAYQRLLWEDFLRDGGEWVPRTFHHGRELTAVPERVVVNCTGDAARTLCADAGMTPVRGQTARLIPQPEVDYAVMYRGQNCIALPRRDGLLVAAMGEHDFGSADLRPDRAQSEAAVRRLAQLF